MGSKASPLVRFALFYYISDMARMFPIGMQSFSVIRENNAIYVDKTGLVYKLVKEGKVYFLARPRRFGKSLLISTLDCYLSGRKELFAGLAIDKLETEWKKHPVLRFDFSKMKYMNPGMLDELINLSLAEYEKVYGKGIDENSPSSRLNGLILRAEQKTGQKVVFLVDEYDAPLLDTLVDKDAFDQMRQKLRDFYSPLKSLDDHLKFIFITGITKFSQLSIFSELNNLKIISMVDDYAALCGITEEELRTQMNPEIEVMAQATGKTFEQVCAGLKRKYDGYHFSKKSPDVYNPFSLINALQDKDLTNYWFETGTPTYLMDWICKFGIDPELLKNGIAASADDFNVPTEGNGSPVPVLYQSGYLTIKGYDESQFLPYTLAYPNEEVAEGFTKGLLKYFSGKDSMAYNAVANTIINGFNSGDVASVMDAIKVYLSDIPYDAAKRDELLYSTLIFGVFRIATPFLVHCEQKSAGGRADIVLETKTAVYVIEFKLDGSIEDALAQIDSRGHLDPYRLHKTEQDLPKKLYKVAVNIDSKKRNIGDWKMVDG
jgi:hypothetical protein